jgi:hypothetical protein
VKSIDEPIVEKIVDKRLIANVTKLENENNSLKQRFEREI